MRTLRPPGPNVTWTAYASWEQPSSSFLRAWVPKRSSLEAKYLGTLKSEDLRRMFFVESMSCS